MIEINGKEYRNIQEQVQKNVEDIEELQEAIADLPDTTYSKTQIDNKDATVLAEAKAYTYSKTESDEKYATITSVNTALSNKVDKFTPTAGAVANIELYDEEEYANLMIGVKGENEALFKNYVSISSDGDVNIKADETFVMGVQNNSGTVLFGKDHDMEFTVQSGYDVNFKVSGLGSVYVTQTGVGPLVKKEIALKEDLIDLQPKLISGTNIKTINNSSILGNGNLNVTNVMIIDAEDTTIDLESLYDLVQTDKYDIMVREDVDGDGTVFNYYYLESTGTNSNKTRFEFNFYSTYLNAQGNTATIVKWQVNNYTDVDTVTWENQVVLNLSNGGGGGTTKYLHKITLTNATYGSVTLDVLLDNNTPITTWALIESNLSSGVDYPAYGSAVYNDEPYVYNHALFDFVNNKVTLTFIGYWTVPGSGTIWKQLNSDWSSSQITISDIVE